MFWSLACTVRQRARMQRAWWLLQEVENKKTFELSEDEINKIRQEVEKYTTEADLVRSARTMRGC